MAEEGASSCPFVFVFLLIEKRQSRLACRTLIVAAIIVIAVLTIQIKRLIHPNGVFIAHYNGKPIRGDVPLSVMGFVFLYALSFALLAVALSYVGLDFLTAMSGAATAISNVGPGLGELIGPVSTFQDLPDSAKWLMSLGMFLGRLEILTVMVMFHPNFWQK